MTAPIARAAATATLAIACAAPAGAEIVGEPVTYEVGGETFEGYLARNTDLAETRGLVLIVHDWDGLTEYEERRAEMLAARGYTAFALDVYGADVEPTTIEENRALSGALYADRETFRARLLGSLAAARALDGVPQAAVVMGYCFGGAAALEMARAGADVAGVVSFHGGLGTPEGQDYAAAAAPVLVLHGSADPVSGMTDLAALLDELQAAGVPHDAEVYGGARHSFTVWGSDDYDVEADGKAWEALTGFLDNRL